MNKTEIPQFGIVGEREESNIGVYKRCFVLKEFKSFILRKEISKIQTKIKRSQIQDNFFYECKMFFAKITLIKATNTSNAAISSAAEYK